MLLTSCSFVATTWIYPLFCALKAPQSSEMFQYPTMTHKTDGHNEPPGVDQREQLPESALLFGVDVWMSPLEILVYYLFIYFYLSLSPHTLVLKQRDAVSWCCGSDKRIPAETPKGVEETVRKWKKKKASQWDAHTHTHIHLTVGLHTPLDTLTVKGWIWFIAVLLWYMSNMNL